MRLKTQVLRRVLCLVVASWSSIGFCGVHFEGIKDGAKVKSPVSLKMKVTGKTLRPAGEDGDDTKTGHHHLIIDGPATPLGEVVAADAKHLHFGKGQDKAEIVLTPGPHSLTLQFADGAHRSYGPEWSKTINVEVQ